MATLEVQEQGETAIFASVEGEQGIAFDILDDYVTGVPGNYAEYSNPYYDELYDKALKTLDAADREALLQELFVILLDDVVFIPLGTEIASKLVWPWVKNYYGEGASVGFLSVPHELIWIDQDLKELMGY